MNKKGFTLVELLAVIVVMALLITIAIPGVMTISNRIQSKMFCEKVSNLESAAKLYAQDNIESVSDGTIREVAIKKLVENNLVKKEDNACSLGSSDKPCVKDPRDSSSMDNNTIKLSIANPDGTYKKAKAEYNYKNDAEKNTCTK